MQRIKRQRGFKKLKNPLEKFRIQYFAEFGGSEVPPSGFLLFRVDSEFRNNFCVRHELQRDQRLTPEVVREENCVAKEVAAEGDEEGDDDKEVPSK